MEKNEGECNNDDDGGPMGQSGNGSIAPRHPEVNSWHISQFERWLFPHLVNTHWRFTGPLIIRIRFSCINEAFLDVEKFLYKLVCPSICPSVHPTVRPSVTSFHFRLNWPLSCKIHLCALYLV